MVFRIRYVVQPLFLTIRMRYLVVLLLCFVSACCPCRHSAVPARQDSVRVEVRTRTEYVRDTVLVPVPAASSEHVVNDTVSELETCLAFSRAAILPNGSLFHSLTHRHTDMDVPVELPVQVRDSIVYREHTNAVETERKPTRWENFVMGMGYALMGMLSLLVVWLAIRLFRR